MTRANSASGTASTYRRAASWARSATVIVGRSPTLSPPRSRVRQHQHAEPAEKGVPRGGAPVSDAQTVSDVSGYGGNPPRALVRGCRTPYPRAAGDGIPVPDLMAPHPGKRVSFASIRMVRLWIATVPWGASPFAV